MVFNKSLLILFLLFCLKANSEIVYHKSDIVVTDIDVNSYIELYESTYGEKINFSGATKDLVLIKNLLKNLQENNNEFLNNINKKIIKLYGRESYENYNTRIFLSFLLIRDEFIIDYFQNNLNEREIFDIFENIENLYLPISDNNCFIIKEVIDLHDNNDFIKSFYFNLKNNSDDYKVIINKTKYDVCIDQEVFKKLERLIILYIQSKTSQKFESFVYDKTKN